MDFNMFEKQRNSEELIVFIEGELDIFTIELVTKRINELSVSKCILDLQNVTFMDSSGIGLILRKIMEWQEEGRVLEFDNIQSPVFEVLEEMGVFTILEEVQS